MLKKYIHAITLICLAVLITSCAAPLRTLLPPTGTPAPPTNTPHPTDTPITEASPTFTPTSLPSLTGSGGGVLAFLSTHDGNEEIYVMNADGSGLQPLTDDHIEHWYPHWSPDGSKIAFHSHRSDQVWSIYTVDVDSANLTQLTHEDTQDAAPVWSPDGTQILFSRNDTLWVMDSDGGNQRQLMDDDAAACCADWSPDGAQIAFESLRNGNSEIYIMAADGSNPRQLTHDAGENWWPDWSPDGKQIAFKSDRDGDFEIYVVNADGSNLRQLTDNNAEDGEPDWSPDGTRLAFYSNRDGDMEIYVMNADGTQVQQLTDNNTDDELPVWKPEPQQSTTADEVRDISNVVDSTPEIPAPPIEGASMLYIPGGTFQMGSKDSEISDALALCQAHYHICNQWYYERESPSHTVSLDEFWIDQTEVTNAQYRRCVDAGVCAEPSTCKKGEPTFEEPNKVDHPVVCVNWQEAQSYCEWVGSRLPSEAEWEYAFRGEIGSIYPWGDEFDGSLLNYCDANCSQSHADERFDDGYPLTAPVGSYPQGASYLGVLDMGGNVSEWVGDWLGDYAPESISNPAGPSTGTEKLLKGCSWFSHPTYCRGALRASVDPNTRFDHLGFRCAASMNPETAGESEMSYTSIKIPSGYPPAIDGTHAPGEWESAAVETFTDGSELLLMQYENYLYLGIRATEPGMIAANVFLQRSDEISILHASAALGTAIYQQGENAWQQMQDFTWQCRSTSLSDAAKAERDAFFQQEGWVAANGRMGTPNELEYQIKIPEGDFRLAVIYIKSSPPYEKIPWPAELSDDTIMPTPGGLPQMFYFKPGQWVELSFQGD